MGSSSHKPIVAHAYARAATALAAEPGLRLVFEEVYAEHFRFVWRALRALGVPLSLVEDAAQDVFVVVHRRLPTFEGAVYLRTWLFAIAKRVASDYRRRIRPFEDLSRAAEVADARPSPLDALARVEGVDLIERVFDAMEEHHRLVFVLMDVEELSANEVAEMLSLNRNTVYSRLNRARESFNQLAAQLGRSPSLEGKS